MTTLTEPPPARPVPRSAVLHETSTRLRVRYAASADPSGIRARLAGVPGVASVRVSPALCCATVRHDGRAATRDAVLAALSGPVAGAAAARPSAGADAPRRREVAPRPILEAAGAALVPLLPAEAGKAVALGLVAGKVVAARRRGTPLAPVTLEAVSLATTALTGHPFTTAASILLSGFAESWRDRLLAELDLLLAGLAPAEDPEYGVRRHGRTIRVGAPALRVGDRVTLAAGQVVPADGVVVRGAAELEPGPASQSEHARRVRRGDRLASGTRLASGGVDLVVERPTERSRAARLRRHVRHALATREQPGALTPDLERLLALPVTTAGLVLALTRDAGRSAAMLQADPQLGLSLAHPVAREAAIHVLARQDVLMDGLEAIDRLATATTVAIEDIGVLTEPIWHLDAVEPRAPGLSPADMRASMAKLAGGAGAPRTPAAFPDDLVTAWMEHGALLRVGRRTLHVGGVEPMRRTWRIDLADPPPRSLERRLFVVEAGRLLATVTLRCRLRRGVGGQLAALRALGVRRLAIFTEGLTAEAPEELAALGADAIVANSREAQSAWLDEASERGEKVALVHTGLRDLLPAGGLSLCPVDAEAGAHGVLLGEPLPSLVAGRAAALRVRSRLRADFGLAVAVSSALLVSSGLRLVPPIATATLSQGFTLALLARSARSARLAPPSPAATSRFPFHPEDRP